MTLINVLGPEGFEEGHGAFQGWIDIIKDATNMPLLPTMKTLSGVVLAAAAIMGLASLAGGGKLPPARLLMVSPLVQGGDCQASRREIAGHLVAKVAVILFIYMVPAFYWQSFEIVLASVFNIVVSKVAFFGSFLALAFVVVGSGLHAIAQLPNSEAEATPSGATITYGACDQSRMAAVTYATWGNHHYAPWGNERLIQGLP